MTIPTDVATLRGSDEVDRLDLAIRTSGGDRDVSVQVQR